MPEHKLEVAVCVFVENTSGVVSIDGMLKLNTVMTMRRFFIILLQWCEFFMIVSILYFISRDLKGLR